MARRIILVAVLLAAWSATSLGADGPQWPDLSPQGRARAVAAPPVRFLAPPPPPAFNGELGLRYWNNWGKAQKDLYGFNQDLVSRLTYGDLRGHSGELFGRVDHTSGFFVKGFGGLGTLSNGNLVDEDFPPGIDPYSSTRSQQEGGYLAYFAIDGGFTLVRQPGFRLGVFAGYHYLDEKLNGYGCAQTASNPDICAGAIPNDVLGITQNNHWHSVRVGGEMEIRLFDRLKLMVDAAYLPYVKLDGADLHWLRIGVTPGAFVMACPKAGRAAAISCRRRCPMPSTPMSTSRSAAVIGAWTATATPISRTASWAPPPCPSRSTGSREHMGVFVSGFLQVRPYPTGANF